MTRKELDSLIIQGEGDYLEFKTKAAHPEKILKEFVAFANTKGGHLLIGVEDNGNIAGLDNPEEEVQVMEQALDLKCQPRLKYSFQFIPVSRKRSVIHYEIYESRTKPHFVLGSSQEGTRKAYVRIKDMSVKASREAREILKGRSRRRTLKFTYGDPEKTLMQYLAEHGNITLRKFAEIAKIPRRRASNILITMSLANVIRIIPSEEEDRFFGNID